MYIVTLAVCLVRNSPTTFKTGSNLACKPLWGIGLRRAHPESWRSLGPGTDHGSSCFQALPGLFLPIASNSNHPAFTFNSIHTHTGTRLHFVPSGLLQQCPLRSQLSPPRSTAANPECCRSTRPETTEVWSHFRCHSKRAALAPRASPDRLQTLPPCPKLFGWRGTPIPARTMCSVEWPSGVAITYGLQAGAICLFLGFARHATVDDPFQSRHPASGIRSPWTYVSYQEIRNNSRRNWRQSCFCNIQQRLCGSISLRGAIQVFVTTTTTRRFVYDWLNCFICFLSLVCLSFYVFCDVDDFRFYHVFINFYYNVLWGIKFIIFISLDCACL